MNARLLPKFRDLRLHFTLVGTRGQLLSRMLTLFCPRDNPKKVETLHWYADVMSAAKKIMCMTFAFNLDKVFATVLEKSGATLQYAVFDKNLQKPVEDLID